MQDALLVNDLTSQFLLRDRREVYKVLQQNGIPLPPHIICNRDGSPDTWLVFSPFPLLSAMFVVVVVVADAAGRAGLPPVTL